MTECIVSEHNGWGAPHGSEPEATSARGRVSTVDRLPASMNDWELLLRAVQSRLRAIAGPAPDTRGPPVADDAPRQARAQVLECVSALGALQGMLAPELGRCHRIERELIESTAALAQSRAELAATRHGERLARLLALHDSLTALPNRLFFTERLDHALTSTARPGIAVVYLDLDGLKSINDRHGHDTGDELLKIVAARLRGALRTHDMVCRLGGDEFACLLIDSLSRQQLERLACKLFDAVSAPMQIGGRALVVRASIGIATCPAEGTTSTELLKQADSAMYCAKRQQTGYAFFGSPSVGVPVGIAGTVLGSITSHQVGRADAREL